MINIEGERTLKICKYSLSHRHSFIDVSMNLHPNTSLFIVLLMYLNLVSESPSAWHLCPFDLSLFEHSVVFGYSKIF